MEPFLEDPKLVLNMHLDEYMALKNGRLSLLGPIDMWDEYALKDLDLALDMGIEKVELVISSPGGEVASGIRVIRSVKEARKRGLSVVGTVRGEAASMAFVLLQACTTRKMAPGDILMAHGVTGGLYGDTKNQEASTKLFTYWREYLVGVVADRVSKTSGFEDSPQAKTAYWEPIFKDETPVYYTPDEALALGLIDEVETD